MKSFSLFMIGVFSYCLWLEGILMAAVEMSLTTYNAPLLIAIPVAAYIFAVLGRNYLLKKADRAEFVRLNFILKVVQAPAHLLNSLLCIGLISYLFTIIFVPFPIVVMILSLRLTGKLGEEAVSWCEEKELLTHKEAARERCRQACPGLDIVSAATLFRKTKGVTL